MKRALLIRVHHVRLANPAGYLAIGKIAPALLLHLDRAMTRINEHRARVAEAYTHSLSDRGMNEEEASQLAGFPAMRQRHASTGGGVEEEAGGNTENAVDAVDAVGEEDAVDAVEAVDAAEEEEDGPGPAAVGPAGGPGGQEEDDDDRLVVSFDPNATNSDVSVVSESLDGRMETNHGDSGSSDSDDQGDDQGGDQSDGEAVMDTSSEEEDDDEEEEEDDDEEAEEEAEEAEEAEEEVDEPQICEPTQHVTNAAQKRVGDALGVGAIVASALNVHQMTNYNKPPPILLVMTKEMGITNDDGPNHLHQGAGPVDPGALRVSSGAAEIDHTRLAPTMLTKAALLLASGEGTDGVDVAYWAEPLEKLEELKGTKTTERMTATHVVSCMVKTPTGFGAYVMLASINPPDDDRDEDDIHVQHAEVYFVNIGSFFSKDDRYVFRTCLSEENAIFDNEHSYYKPPRGNQADLRLDELDPATGLARYKGIGYTAARDGARLLAMQCASPAERDEDISKGFRRASGAMTGLLRYYAEHPRELASRGAWQTRKLVRVDSPVLLPTKVAVPARMYANTYNPDVYTKVLFHLWFVLFFAWLLMIVCLQTLSKERGATAAVWQHLTQLSIQFMMGAPRGDLKLASFPAHAVADRLLPMLLACGSSGTVLAASCGLGRELQEMREVCLHFVYSSLCICMCPTRGLHLLASYRRLRQRHGKPTCASRWLRRQRLLNRRSGGRHRLWRPCVVVVVVVQLLRWTPNAITHSSASCKRRRRSWRSSVTGMRCSTRTRAHGDSLCSSTSRSGRPCTMRSRLRWRAARRWSRLISYCWLRWRSDTARGQS